VGVDVDENVSDLERFDLVLDLDFVLVCLLLGVATRPTHPFPLLASTKTRRCRLETPMSSTPPTTQENQYLVLRIICGAYLFSLAIYVVVARIVAGQGLGLEPLPELLPWILVGVAAMTLVAAQPLSAVMIANAAKQPTAEARQGGYRSAVIVAFAVREVAGIFGLVLTILTGDFRWVLVLAAAAALAMLIGWPKRSEFDRMATPDSVRPIG